MDEPHDFATGAGLHLYQNLVEDDRLVGRELGDYKIESLLAEGGMSRVYLAHRIDGAFERQVAIKVSAIGTWNADLAQRFMREQQLLATFNNSSICQLYDAGATEEGWPYIVMEYIQGLDIVAHCGQHRVSLGERLMLLIDTVRAVAFAHNRLIVHRDIKPSNIMVDAEGRVRLLDFGIAKVVSDEDTGLDNNRLLTPRYASPEQIIGAPITVASDIYQLGLLIYETLQGEPIVNANSYPEIVKRAADSIPVRVPSGVSLQSELRAIIEKCLAHSPDERYSDAHSLADDLLAFTEQRPVQAVSRQPSYYLRKLIMRNQGMSALVFGLAIALVIGAATYTVQISSARDQAELQASIASLEARKANQVVDFMAQLFGSVAPGEAKGESITLAAALNRGVQQVRLGLNDQPELKASLMLSIAQTFLELGDYDTAKQLSGEALKIRRELFDEDLLSVAEVKLQLVNLANRTAEYSEAERLLRQVSIDLDNFSGERRDLLQAEMFELNGNLVFLTKDGASAETYYQQALGLLQKYELENTMLGVTLQYNLMVVKGAIGDVNGELEGLRGLMGLFEATFGTAHPMMMTIENEMTWALASLQKHEEAITWGARGLATAEKLFGKDHHELSNSLGSLAMIHADLEQFDEAAGYVERSVEVTRKGLGEYHTDTGLARQQLAYVYIRQQRYDEAQLQLDEARKAIWGSLPADTHQFHGDWYFASGGLQGGRGNLEAAAGYYQKAWDVYQVVFGSDHIYVSDATTQLAGVRAKQRRYEEAEALYAIGVPIIYKLRGTKAPSAVRVTKLWADVLQQLGREDEAVSKMGNLRPSSAQQHF